MVQAHRGRSEPVGQLDGPERKRWSLVSSLFQRSSQLSTSADLLDVVLQLNTATHKWSTLDCPKCLNIGSAAGSKLAAFTSQQLPMACMTQEGLQIILANWLLVLYSLSISLLE